MSGRRPIGDVHSCTIAGVSLGLTQTPATLQTLSLPPGCTWNGNTLDFVALGSTAKDCSVSESCLCFSALTCSHVDGKISNSAPCLCGATGCTIISGLYCISATNTCSKGTICSNKNGILANDVACQCGINPDVAVSCNIYNGMVCNVDSNMCQHLQCLSQDGTQLNSIICACGTNVCRPDWNGGYCYLPDNKCQIVPDKSWVSLCNVTDGSLANPSSCVCGDSVCDQHSTTGLYCNAADSRCGCSPGWYGREENMGICKACARGKYSEQSFQAKALTCITCPGGFFTNEAGQDICESCPSGWLNSDKGFFAEAHHECDKCPLAQISKQGATFCYDCPVGTYNTTNFTEPCQLCPQGFMSKKIGKDENAYSICFPCGRGEYQTESGKPYWCVICACFFVGL